MLAMHSVASPASHADRAMTTEHSTVIVEPNQAADVSLGDCAGCPKNMAMTVMWCVLALLTATLVLLLAPRSTRLRRRRLRRLRPPPPSHYRLVWYLASFDGGDSFAPLAGAPSLVTIASDPTRLAGLVGVDPDGRLWIGFATPNADWTPASSVTGAPQRSPSAAMGRWQSPTSRASASPETKERRGPPSYPLSDRHPTKQEQLPVKEVRCLIAPTRSR